MQNHEIIKRFSSHTPTPDQAARIVRVRDIFLVAATELAKVLPEGREDALTFTKLEEASFHAISGITREGKL